MTYMRTPYGTRVPVTVTRVRGDMFDAEGDGVRFADVPFGVTLEDESGHALTAQTVYAAAHADELSALRARVEASGALDAARRAEERIDKLLDALEAVPLLSGIVARLRSTEKDGDAR